MAKSATNCGTASALEFLADSKRAPLPSVCAVFGDDAYVKAEVLTRLRRDALGSGDDEFALSVFNGDEVQLRDVRDAISARSLFGTGRRLVIVEDADTFVSNHRAG